MARPPARNYGYVRSVDELAKMMKVLGDTPDPFGFDIETGYEGPPREKGALAWHHGTFIVGFSFTTDPKWARYVPLRHDYAEENLDPDKVWEIMQPVLEQPRVVAHNLKFEKAGCRTVGIEIGSLACTMLQAYVLSLWTNVDQKSLVEKIFGHQQRTLAELFPTAKKKELDALRFNTLGLTPDVVAYGCEDASWCLALHQINMPKLEADPSLLSIYRMEMSIMELMLDAEQHGVGVDWDTMEKWLVQAVEFMGALEDEVRADFGALVGQSLAGLNVKSPHQLRKIFFDPQPQGLGLTPSRWTKGGEKSEPVPSTEEVALVHLAKRDRHTEDDSCRSGLHENCTPDPIGQAVKKLLTAREVDNHRKRFELWLDKSPFKYPNRGFDDRVHAHYAQHIVGTGRFAADKPPIQQLPKKFSFELRDGRAFKGNIRDLIMPTPGYYLCGFDYSQIELRAVAGLAQERSLLEAFKRGDDVHTLTAALMLGKDVEEVDDEHDRPIGKTMNFAIIYQMGVRSLADRLGISQDEAQVLFDSYWASFPAVASYVSKSKMECMRRSPLPYTRSHFGRRWTIWNLANTNASKAQYAIGERQAVNAPVQGWAADYTKLAMLRAARRQKDLGWYAGKTWLLMNQHDALIYEVSEDIAPTEFIREMRPAVEFPIPDYPDIVTEWEFGYRYGSAVRVSGDTEFERSTDGRWSVKGSAPPAERDEFFEGEVERDFHEVVGPSLPEEPDEVGDLRPVVVEVGRGLTESEFHAFMRLISSRPGPYQVTLKLPDGEAVLWSGSAVGVGQSAEVALVLPGSTVYSPSDRGIDVRLVAEAL